MAAFSMTCEKEPSPERSSGGDHRDGRHVEQAFRKARIPGSVGGSGRISPGSYRSIKEGLSRHLDRLDQVSWIVFTSTNGVRIFFEAMREGRMDLRALGYVKFAVVGSGTGKALEEQGFFPDYMPEEYTTEALARGLLSRIRPGESVLIPRARMGSPDPEGGIVPGGDLCPGCSCL